MTTRRIAQYRKPALAQTSREPVFYSSDFDLAIEAQVRSGDFFVTLATRLDGLGREVPEVGARASIDRMVSELIYLQERYRIMRTSRS